MNDLSEKELSEDSFQELQSAVRTKPSNENVTSSVQDFLKQSTEIQAEIRKISELCSKITPSVNDSIQSETLNISWDDLNRTLNSFGFNPILLYKDKDNLDSPDFNSLCECIVEVVTEYSNLNKGFDGLKESSEQRIKQLNDSLIQSEKSKKIEAQYKDLDKINRQLQEKLAKYRADGKNKAEALDQLINIRGKPPGEKPSIVFKGIMGQEFNSENELDVKVMGIILRYEDQRQKLIAELQAYKTASANVNSSFKRKEMSFEEYQRNGKYQRIDSQNRSQDSEKDEILNSVISQLNLKSFSDIPIAINKIQKVIVTLPGVDKFIKEICMEISLPTASRLEEVLDTVRELKHTAQRLEKFKRFVCDQFETENEKEICENIKGLKYFCRLFEVTDGKNVINTIESVFYFVHEIKLFLADVRKILGIQSEVKVVLEEVTRVLQKEGRLKNISNR